ncbi:hypothetical protein [Gramella sp. AN32]|uniref:Lipoprotein n=1 Tax=Christiangramia antarctica TaxID=2058158 RepID=A0ABW5X262_9FLAO|nr:hypothetical protein [Gramella sp. AN32]MCM4155188.1 hypothetical protein [Gramella sp. AN32]
MNKFMMFLSLIILAGCSGTKTTSKSNAKSYSIENLENLNSEEIKSIYADANIQEASEMFEEGTTQRPYSILYPDTENELMLIWKNKEKDQIYEIRTKGNGKWASNTGIKVGDSYQTLVEKNGKDISFYGFGWDYGGAVLWNGGKLENSGLRVFLQPEATPPSKFYSDKIAKATAQEIQDMNLKVASIVINYASE